jgi:tetratricopeptide (TPR) repeat protein
LGALWNARANAQADPTPSSQPAPNSYDSFIEQGVTAYDSGRFAEARAAFRRAHEMNPTARTSRTIGMCSFNLGDYVDAATNLEASLEDARKPLTGEQRKQVADLLARSTPRIGRFAMKLAPTDATLSVDGRPASLNAQRELLVEPGRHEISVQAPDHRPVQSVVNVEGGDHTTLEFTLAPADRLAELPALNSPQPMAADDLRSSPATGRDDGSRLQSTLGYVSLSVGAAGLVGFGVVSALALMEQHKLNDRCPDSNCGPAHFSELDRYDALKTASTAALIGGGAFVLLGGALLLFQSEREPARAKTDGDPKRASIEPMIGPGSLGLRGSL